MIIRSGSVNSKREVRLKFYLDHKLDSDRVNIFKSLGLDVDEKTYNSFCIMNGNEIYDESGQQLLDNDLNVSIVNIQ